MDYKCYCLLFKTTFPPPPLTSMQSDMLSTFGGLFRNEQLMRLSERLIPFRLLVDCDHEYDSSDSSRLHLCRFQMSLCSSPPYEYFKLRRSISPQSTARFEADENEYMLETSDGKFLSVTDGRPIEFTVCDIPKQSCLFFLLPQPDGRIAIQSQLNEKFIIVYLDVVELETSKYMKKIEMEFGSTDSLSDSTKFLLAPEPEKQNEWCAEFGGSIGLQQLNRLQTLRLPFYLLAEEKMFRFCVNVQKIYEIQGDYQTAKFQGYPYTFTLHGGCADGTNCLLYASCGEYLCVEHRAVLGTSPLKLDINDATPLPKFLFDFVPCPVKHTFSIRSQYNQKYLRYNDGQKILDYNYSIYADAFSVNGTEKTASEFVLAPISISYAHTTRTEL